MRSFQYLEGGLLIRQGIEWEPIERLSLGPIMKFALIAGSFPYPHPSFMKSDPDNLSHHPCPTNFVPRFEFNNFRRLFAIKLPKMFCLSFLILFSSKFYLRASRLHVVECCSGIFVQAFLVELKKEAGRITPRSSNLRQRDDILIKCVRSLVSVNNRWSFFCWRECGQVQTHPHSRFPKTDVVKDARAPLPSQFTLVYRKFIEHTEMIGDSNIPQNSF